MKIFKKWAKAAAVRAVRTFAETLSCYLMGAAIFSEVDWKTAISAALFSIVVTFVLALKGLPEVNLEAELNALKEATKED